MMGILIDIFSISPFRRTKNTQRPRGTCRTGMLRPSASWHDRNWAEFPKPKP